MFKIIGTEEEFNAIKSDWDDFIYKNSVSNVFLSHDWIASWIISFLKRKRGKRLFIIVEYDEKNNEIKSIAPFYIEDFFFIFKCLRFISDDYSDYLGILTADFSIKNVLAEIHSHIKANSGRKKKLSGINIVYLKQVSEEQKDKIVEYKNETQVQRSPLRQTSKDRLHLVNKSSGDCYYIDLPGSIEEYIKGFNSKQRYNILKRVKNAEKEGIRYVAISIKNGSDNNIDYYLEEFFKLHQKRWHDKSRSGVFHNDKIKTFFKNLFTVLYNNGILNLSFLKYNEKLIAASACFDVKDKRQVYLPGFNPEYSFLHPGIVLTYYNIREAVLLNYKEFDFLKGSEDYKKRFLGIKRANYKIYLYKTKIIYPIFKLNLFLKNEFFPKIKSIFIYKYE